MNLIYILQRIQLFKNYISTMFHRSSIHRVVIVFKVTACIGDFKKEISLPLFLISVS